MGVEAADYVDVAGIKKFLIEHGAEVLWGHYLHKTWPFIRIADELGVKTLEELRSIRFEDFASTGPFNSNPIVDGWVIPDDPWRLYEQGKQHDVPLIVGGNRDEATFRLVDSKIKTLKDYESRMRKFFKENADEVLEAYPAKDDKDVFDAMNLYGTDTFMTLHDRKLCRWMDQAGLDAYRYFFTRVPPTPGGKRLGAHHGAEIPYVFGLIGPGWGQAAEVDRQLSNAMMTYWIRFAASGNPNCESLPEWPRYDSGNDLHIEFGDEIKTGTNLRKRELDVLEKYL